jgi:hypothetical protein
MQPLPPSPALILIIASSMNMLLFIDCTGRQRLHINSGREGEEVSTEEVSAGAHAQARMESSQIGN